MQTLNKVFAWYGETGLHDRQVTYITDDSRKLQQGCVFVCIEGSHFDGHSKAQEALDAGAAAIVVQRDLGLAQQVIVENSRYAYAMLCAAFFGNPADSLKMIGVTGTNGKTTVCFLLKEILEYAGYKTGLIGTVKTMIGDMEQSATLTTPDPFDLQRILREMADAGCKYCCMEVSSQALHQQRVAGVRFAAALFTNLTQDHLDYHGTMEEYKAAKHKLFEQAEISVINLDDAAAQYMMHNTESRNVTVSHKTDASDYTAKNIRLKPDGVTYEIVGNGIIGRISFPVPGLFSVSNSLCAAACAVELGIDFPVVLQAVAKTSVPGRLERVDADVPYAILIDYAHTPDALENVLGTLKAIAPARVLCVFGCGGDRDAGKRPVMGEIAARLSDVAIVTSDNPRSEDPEKIVQDILAGIPQPAENVRVEVDRKKAIALAMREAQPEDIILLAGKGQETYQILADGKIHFDEREIVQDILQKA